MLKINKTKVWLFVIVLWIIIIASIIVVSCNLNNDTETITAQSAVIQTTEPFTEESMETVVEETQSTDTEDVNVIYSKFTEEALILENVTKSLCAVGVDTYTAETVAFMFSMYSEGIVNWYLSYNDGYCPTIKLYINDNEVDPYITVMEFNNHCYVGHVVSTGDYIFCRDGASMLYTEVVAETVCEMLNGLNTGWTWNCYDAICAWGLIETLMPNNPKSVTDDAVIVEGKGVFTFGKACLYYNEAVYQLYVNIASDSFVPKDYWQLLDTFSLDNVRLWLETNEIEEPRRLDEILTSIQPPTDFWYMELVNGYLYLYDIVIDTEVPEGYTTREMFRYDYKHKYYILPE